MKRLFSYMKQYWFSYVIATTLLLGCVALDMVVPKFIEILIDDVVLASDFTHFTNLLGILAGITIARAIIGYLKEYVFDVTSATVIKSLRADLYKHIQGLSFSFFDKKNTGELMSRIKGDVDSAWDAISYGFMILFEFSLNILFAYIMLFSINVKLAALCLISMPIVIIAAIKLEKEYDKTYDEISDQEASINTTAEENISGMQVVKAFCREKYEINKFLSKNEENYNLNIKQAKNVAKYWPWMNFYVDFVIFMVIVLGGILVIKNEITPGELLAFYLYTTYLAWPMKLMGWITNLVSQANTAMKKVNKLFAESPEIKAPETCVIEDN